ncbi:MAG: hypothetical protein QW255_05175 [Candidatus Bilamarchaeaceae archaeon]
MRRRTYSVDQKIRKYSDIEIPQELSAAAERYALRMFDYIQDKYIENRHSIRTGDLYTFDQTFLEEYAELKSLFHELFNEYDQDNDDPYIEQYYIKSQIEKYLERLMNDISWIPLNIYFDVLEYYEKRSVVAITRVNDNFVKDLMNSSCEAINRWKFVSYFTGEKLKCLFSYPDHVDIDSLTEFFETEAPIGEISHKSGRGIEPRDGFVLYVSRQSKSKQFGIHAKDLIEKYVFVGYDILAGLVGEYTKRAFDDLAYVVIDSSVHMMGGYNFIYSSRW